MSAAQSGTRVFRLDRLLGRNVLDGTGHPVGRLEEFRAEPRGTALLITGYVIGAAGLFERLGIAVKMVLGRRVGGYLARWDQVDVRDETRPRLTCAISDLQRL